MRHRSRGKSMRVVPTSSTETSLPPHHFASLSTQRRVISAKVSSVHRSPPVGSSTRASKPAGISRNSGCLLGICFWRIASGTAVEADRRPGLVEPCRVSGFLPLGKTRRPPAPWEQAEAELVHGSTGRELDRRLGHRPHRGAAAGARTWPLSEARRMSMFRCPSAPSFSRH